MSQPGQTTPTPAPQVTTVKTTQFEVQVEVAPPPAKAAKEAPALDPFDALASILPSVTPLVLPEPVYTGPEVHELPAPADANPKDVPKPMSTDEALDSLSFGFMSAPAAAAAAAATPAKQEKPMSTDEALDSLSFGFVSAPAAAAAATPAKQEKPMSTDEALDSLSFGFVSAPAAAAAATPAKQESPAPPADKKAKIDTVSEGFSRVDVLSSPAPPQKPVEPKPAATTVPKFDAMSLDALAALGDTLGAPEPVAEIPELRPEDIVSEAKLEEEEGVLVGERDDTLPPEYRYSEEKLKDLPAPKPEPTLAPGEALDFLSGDFMTYPTTAPVVQAPVIPSAPPAQDKVENLSALDALAGDFLTPTQAAVVQAPLPSPAKKTPKSDVCDSAKPNTATEVTPKKPEAKPALKKDDSLSLDALSALSDTLAAPEPAPEPPKLRPEDIVSEAKVEEEEGVLVGERDDTLPPEYRYSEEKLKDLPAPKPEPTLNTGEALDFLSGDFMTPAVRPPAHALPTSTQPPAAPSKHAEAAALDALAGDFIATAVVAPAVKCAASQPAQASRQMSEGTTSALDALSDTLADIKPVPEPAPVPMKDIAKEKKITEERLIKMGEDDDTLPPEYRPTEEDLKAMAKAEEEAAKAPKEKPMGEAAALDLLSGDFAMAPGPAAPVAAPSAAPCLAPAPVLQPPVLHSEPLKPMAAPALDSLAGTLLPSAMEGKTKGDKPKKHRAEDPSAVEQLSAELSTDVVSTKKGGKS